MPSQRDSIANNVPINRMNSCLRQILFGLDHVTTRVRPTAQMNELVLVGDIVIRLIAISHQCRAWLDAWPGGSCLRFVARVCAHKSKMSLIFE
jgi:hypothetical protein